MMLKRVGYFISLLVCSLCGYYLLQQYYASEPNQVMPDAEKPLFTSETAQTTRYDQDGMRNYQLQAKHVEYYQLVDETHFNLPVLWTYNEQQQQEWKVTADFAVLEDKHLLLMQGNVRIKNLLPQSQLKRATTDTLTLDLNSRDYWSDDHTKIEGVGFTSEGEQVKGNFNAQLMELFNQVKTEYESKTD